MTEDSTTDSAHHSTLDSAITRDDAEGILVVLRHVHVVHLDDGVVVLDIRNDRLHHLNRPAALVLASIDGRRTIAEIAELVAPERSPTRAELVVSALRSSRPPGS